MHLIVEYSGTPEQAEIADAIVGFSHEYADGNINTVVGSTAEPVIVYDEDLNKVAEFNDIPDYTELHFYLGDLIE